MMRVFVAVLTLFLAVASGVCAAAPRTAVMSAFEPELALLKAQAKNVAVQRINGVEFITGDLQGQAVVMLLSGISMVNAAMNTQLLLDRFTVDRIVFSGIAGGVNPALHIGDVTVPEHWSPYLEAVFAREVKPGVFQPPGWMKDTALPGFGMILPRPVGVRSEHAAKEESREWFDADPALLAIARKLRTVPLQRFGQPAQCLSHEPVLVVGGNGVSGQAFVDNAKFREYAFATFHANVLDMETAAVAQVAYANSVPMIAFRSLSDLAGGGEGENEIGTFFQVAADNSARVVTAFLKALPPRP